MFDKERLEPLIGSLTSGSHADELIFFANTAGEGNGMTAGRDVYVMAYLLEVGVPLRRMARLKQGFHGWKASGRPVVQPLNASPSVPLSDGLPGFLELSGMGHLAEPLVTLSLESCAKALEDGRPALLDLLKERGLGYAEAISFTVPLATPGTVM
jgi:hypothetical protein